MPVVNPLARELVFKVVYYGPGLGGKTTSLQHIYSTARPERRGKMVSLATPVDRTLYFDFLPIRLPSARDMTVRLQLFTVPGQVYYNATRKLVLTGADGVVFVVDSQRARADANIESLRNLEENLAEHGRGLEEIPHVFSYNKRDLPALVPIDDMERLLNPRGAPSFATISTTGEGVYETLEAITRAVLEDFEHRMPEHRGLAPSDLMLPEGGLAEALRFVDEGQAADSNQARRPPLKYARSASSGDSPSLTAPADDFGEQVARMLAEQGTRPGLGTTGESTADFTADELASPVDAMSRVVATLAGGAKRHERVAISEMDRVEPATVSEGKPPGANATSTAAAATVSAGKPPDANATPPGSRVLDVQWGGPGQATRGQSPIDLQETQPERRFSLAGLWPDDERATVVRIEDSIQSGELRDAVLLTDVLVQRLFEQVLAVWWDARAEPAVLMLLLGMRGDSIVRFRALCARVRAVGAEPSQEEATEALLFATELRLAGRKLQF